MTALFTALGLATPDTPLNNPFGFSSSSASIPGTVSDLTGFSKTTSLSSLFYI